jgi:hypothetical protein
MLAYEWATGLGLLVGLAYLVSALRIARMLCSGR